MTDIHAAWIIAVCAIVTIMLRFLPFILFSKNRKTPAFLSQLSHALPNAIMGMLVVYCLKGISLQNAPFGIPEIISCLVVALIHIWKRNTLLSIGMGTACYMFLIQVIF